MNMSETITLDTPGWSNPSLPVLIYRGGAPTADPVAVKAVLGGNARRPDWRNGVYPFHHFHSTAHEAFACVTGSATLTLGGPDGLDVRIEVGGLLVLPAGTGHRRVEASALVEEGVRDGDPARQGSIDGCMDVAERRRAEDMAACDPVDARVER